jgi:FlaA1/EpsC-like NDP-sugar epimerase
MHKLDGNQNVLITGASGTVGSGISKTARCQCRFTYEADWSSSDQRKT